MVFVRKTESEELFNIENQLGLHPVAGDVGIEIEVEGNSFPKSSLPKGWAYHQDNSLRGADHAEYVLARPILFAEVPDMVDSIFKSMDSYGSKIKPSNRTSVHVHLNVTKFHLNRLAAFMALYFANEEILSEWCGEHRKGNLFCLRAKDAPAIVTDAASFIRENMDWRMHEGHHYGGLALDAMRKYGSLEVRLLRGVSDPQIIKDWVAILQRLYEASIEYPDPREICESFSYKGPIAFYNDLFGPMARVLQDGAELSDDFIRQSLYEGVRMYAQDLCYAKDWSTFKPVDARRDPFGRKVKKRSTTQAQQFLDIEMEVPNFAPASTQTFAVNTATWVSEEGNNLNWGDEAND